MRLTTRGPKVAKAIAEHQAFTTSGSLRADFLSSAPYQSSGSLPSDIRETEWAEATLASYRGLSVYVVWSYATPIAWHIEGRGWTVPNVRYSVTTSKHQGNLYLIEGEIERPVAGRIMRDGAGRVEASTGGAWAG